MEHWIDSLQQNAFDVFQVVWIGAAIYSTYAFTRMHLNTLMKLLLESITKAKKEIIDAIKESK